MPHAMTPAAPPPATAPALAGQGPRVVAIAALLASAGVPLYIHLPRFAAELGLGLGTVAALLLALRALDFLQDPALGLLVDRYPRQRRALATLALTGIGAGFVAVFTLQPALPGLVAALVLVFTAYSLGTILFYGQGAALAGPGGGPAHYRLAGLREAGTLAGIVAAAVLPELLARGWGTLGGYAGFGLVLGLAALLVALVCRRFWGPVVTERQSLPLRPFLAAGGGRLLLIGLLNTMPVAITSTLFLFFVEDRLALPGLAGPFLVLFFAAAGLSAPLWSRLAARFGARRGAAPGDGAGGGCLPGNRIAAAGGRGVVCRDLPVVRGGAGGGHGDPAGAVRVAADPGKVAGGHRLWRLVLRGETGACALRRAGAAGAAMGRVQPRRRQPGAGAGGVERRLCHPALRAETARHRAGGGSARGGCMMDPFDGKTWWIVGASEGLGRALAEALDATGARLVLSARGAERLEAVAEGLRDARAVPMDVSDAASVQRAAEAAGGHRRGDLLRRALRPDAGDPLAARRAGGDGGGQFHRRACGCWAGCCPAWWRGTPGGSC